MTDLTPPGVTPPGVTPGAALEQGKREAGRGIRGSLAIAGRGGTHPFARFLLTRVAAGIVTLLVASVLIFGMTNVLPGDVASVVLGRSASAQTIKEVRARLGLERPLVLRYGDWLNGLLHGDLGQSTVQLAQGATSAPIGGDIGEALGNSAILAGISFAVFLPLALLLGILAGVNAGSFLDYLSSYTSLVLGALPEFVTATFLIAIFFTRFDLLPPVAGFAPGQSPLSDVTRLVLPVLTLLAASIASGMRLIRAGLVDVMQRDYVAMAHLHGYSWRRIIARYGLRNALGPTVVVVAQVAAYLLAGIIVTENVFNYPGVGRLLVQAVATRDVAVVQSTAMILAAIYVGLNIVADFCVVLLVPRLRTGG